MTYHIRLGRELMVSECLRSHPLDWSVFVVSQTMVVHGEEISG